MQANFLDDAAIILGVGVVFLIYLWIKGRRF